MADTEGHPCRTCRVGSQGSTVRSVEPDSKPRESGVDVGERLSLWHVGKAVRGQAMTANRTRENRLSGMTGGLAETWAMVKAKRAHNVETPKQTSLHLRLRALHFYPDRAQAVEADQRQPWTGNQRGESLHKCQW
jgi:hypothetical protein